MKSQIKSILIPTDFSESSENALGVGISVFFIGPFVQQVLNHSNIPVLSIKPAENQIGQVHSANISEMWGRTIKSSAAEKRKKK